MGKTDSKASERIGMEKYNNKGELMKIIEYKNVHDITIVFVNSKNKNPIKTRWKCFDKGEIRNPENYERLGEYGYNT